MWFYLSLYLQLRDSTKHAQLYRRAGISFVFFLRSKRGLDWNTDFGSAERVDGVRSKIGEVSKCTSNGGNFGEGRLLCVE